MELCRVRQEIESLRLAIPLLVEDMEETETAPSCSTTHEPDAVARKAAQPVRAPQDPTAGCCWLSGRLLDLS